MAKRFRVALTFAGEKRAYVAEMAEILASLFGKGQVLYDQFHEAEFSRSDLALYLPKLYVDDSDLVVGVFCKNYGPAPISKVVRSGCSLKHLSKTTTDGGSRAAIVSL